MEFDRHTYYIAASYAMLVIAVIVELIAVRKRRAAARQQASMMSAVHDTEARQGQTAQESRTAPEAS